MSGDGCALTSRFRRCPRAFRRVFIWQWGKEGNAGKEGQRGKQAVDISEFRIHRGGDHQCQEYGDNRQESISSRARFFTMQIAPSAKAASIFRPMLQSIP